MNDLTDDNFNDDDENKLPIFKHKEEIIEAVENNQIVIIHGQTGCGKTTQVPQYLFKEGIFGNEMIGITQPRKVAAVCTAMRVAKEMDEAVGKKVGYEIRFEKKCGASTKLKYMTDGILLNEIILDRNLKNYKIIMVDEAHERSVNSDILLGLLKDIAAKRDDLKIIISSATISVEKFIAYFEKAKVVLVESRMFNVQVTYRNNCNDYIKETIEIVRDIHLQEQKLRESDGYTKGDILVFLTGQEEICVCCDELSKIENVVPIPLCGSIEFASQQDAFEDVRPYETKVVVATNIAETSITIEGIKYVIDCGYVKQNRFNRQRGMEVLEDVRISKAQAEQRKGRAGRTRDGVCYRLYKKSTYDSFKEEAIPEIKRKNLFEIYLRLRALTLNPYEFNFLDSPNPNELEFCQKELILLGLLKNDDELTGFGKTVSELPLDPILGKVLVTSSNNKCTTDVICIVAMLSEKMQKIFLRPRKTAAMADNKKREFNHPGGDHFTLLKVYKEWDKASDKNKWCKENYINDYTMTNVKDIIKQLQNILKGKNLVIDDKSTDNTQNNIKKSFVAGFFRNICIRQPRDVYLRVYDREVFNIFGNSVLKESRPRIILFHEAIKTTKSFASGVMELNESFLRDNFKRELTLIKFPEDNATLN